jgi:hypothetical protein
MINDLKIIVHAAAAAAPKTWKQEGISQLRPPDYT